MDIMKQFTDLARRTVTFAQEEARLLGHNYIGTEHLLLGLIHEDRGVAAQVLVALGITMERARQEVEDWIGLGITSGGTLPFTPRCKRTLELSLREALHLGTNIIATEHILLSLLREGEGVACQILVKLGIGLDDVRKLVISMLVSSSIPPATEVRELQVELQPRRTQSIRARQSDGSTLVVLIVPGGLSEDQVGKLRDHADEMLKKQAL